MEMSYYEIDFIDISDLVLQSWHQLLFDLGYWWFRGLEQIGNDERLVVDLLKLWFTVPDYLDINWYLMFMMTVLRLWVDGSVTDIISMDEIFDGF